MYVILFMSCTAQFKPCSLSLYIFLSVCLSICLHRLSEPPESLDNLSDSLGLLEELQGKVPQLEQQFEPLTAQFNVLEKYDVTVSEEVGRLGGAK